MLKPAAALRKDSTNATTRDVLQHRHFAVIAGVIKESFGGRLRADVAKAFAEKLGETNAKFDHLRFMAACGVE